ncbi:MAG TPA: hypothetical protein VGE54_02390 [Brevundimonas sp.]
MRPLILLAPAALLLLSACAGGMSGGSSYTSEIERHSAACTARGGILTPTGETTGRVETEYACKINGETARAGH